MNRISCSYGTVLHPLQAKLLSVLYTGIDTTAMCPCLSTGDSAQAIYAFRGAHRNSLQRFTHLFHPSLELRLSCCFRCPRRVVYLASYLQPHIRATPTAAVGEVTLTHTNRAFDYIETSAHKTNTQKLFLCRTNRIILIRTPLR